MARLTKTVTVQAEGRDKGKSFLLTEMSATRAEDWLMRAVSAMAKANVDIPPDIINMGWGAIGFAGLRAILSAPYAEVRPIVNEMMECVQIVEAVATRSLTEDDIEEVQTRLWLRDEVLRLHANFSMFDAIRAIQSITSVEAEQAAGDISAIAPSPAPSGS